MKPSTKDIELTPLERRILARVRKMSGAGVMCTAAVINAQGGLQIAEVGTVARTMDRLTRYGLLRIGPMHGRSRTWLPRKEA